jgi:hypothetical protein
MRPVPCRHPIQVYPSGTLGLAKKPGAAFFIINREQTGLDISRSGCLQGSGLRKSHPHSVQLPLIADGWDRPVGLLERKLGGSALQVGGDQAKSLRAASARNTSPRSRRPYLRLRQHCCYRLPPFCSPRSFCAWPLCRSPLSPELRPREPLSSSEPASPLCCSI